MWQVALDALSEFLTKAVVPILASAMLGVATAWLKEQIAQIKNERIREALDEAVDRLVRAAEQLYGPGRGEEKFNYVMSRLKQEGLAEHADASYVEATVNRLYPNFIVALDADGPTNGKEE